jgi:hypothetical protein
MAALLMLRGFVLQEMERNHNNSGKNVFYFKNGEQLKQAMKELSELK